MDTNLRMIMVYLALTESVILVYALMRENFQVMILVGFFLIMMIGSMEFYGEINNVAIDENFPLFFLYTGLSHILFGVMADMDKIKSQAGGGNRHKGEYPVNVVLSIKVNPFVLSLSKDGRIYARLNGFYTTDQY